MRVWRIAPRRFCAFDGEGARRYAGRWNRPGIPIVYTSQSLSLAALEFLVHLEASQAPSDLVSCSAELPDQLVVASPIELPPDWREYPAPESLQRLGHDWALRRESVGRRVPSVVIPGEHNVLLNPAHPDFPRLKLREPEPFSFDPRLWRSQR